MNTPRAHILLVDDNHDFLDSTTWLLEGAGFEVEPFPSAEDLLQRLAGSAVLRLPVATCIVSDIRMPGLSGIQLQGELKRRNIKLPLVFVTGHGDVPLAVSAMREGAANFIEKPFEADTLIQAIEATLKKSELPDGAIELVNKLTPREREVMDLVVVGKPNKIIADILGISIKTVEMHRSHMMSKLGVRNIQELLRLVLADSQGQNA